MIIVTGASGFIGANLVHELVARGHHVRALLREGSDLRGLEGVSYERVPGDLGDRKALTAGLRGVDWCFHVAASYHLWLPDYAPMYAANVEGTRNVLEAAGLSHRYDFEEQASTDADEGRRRPDVTVRLPGGIALAAAA